MPLVHENMEFNYIIDGNIYNCTLIFNGYDPDYNGIFQLVSKLSRNYPSYFKDLVLDAHIDRYVVSFNAINISSQIVALLKYFGFQLFDVVEYLRQANMPIPSMSAVDDNLRFICNIDESNITQQNYRVNLGTPNNITRNHHASNHFSNALDRDTRERLYSAYNNQRHSFTTDMLFDSAVPSRPSTVNNSYPMPTDRHIRSADSTPRSRSSGRGANIVLKTVYVDMDGVLADFDGALKVMWPRLNKQDSWNKAKKEIGFFRSIEPIKGAIESFVSLFQKYNVYILSTPIWENPSSYTEKCEWVREHIGKIAEKRLILSHNKGLLIGDYLIDDKNHDFKGELIRFGSKEYPNWNKVLEYLGVDGD